MIVRRSPWLVRFFTRHVKRFYLARNFHAVRLSRTGRPAPVPDVPLIVVLNHPSWWDPLVGLVLTELFPDRAHYAPMDAHALLRYRIFERLGVFGIEPATSRGAREFLRTGCCDPRAATDRALDHGPGPIRRPARKAGGHRARGGSSRTSPATGRDSAAGSGVSLLARALPRSTRPIRPGHRRRARRRPVRRGVAYLH